MKNLKNIGFYPAYGKEKTMKKIMNKSVAGEMPQFYFVFRKEQLIGYMFIIGDTQKYRAFPWLAISNVDHKYKEISYMKVLDVFSWLPEKQISLGQLEQIFRDVLSRYKE